MLRPEGAGLSVSWRRFACPVCDLILKVETPACTTLVALVRELQTDFSRNTVCSVINQRTNKITMALELWIGGGGHWFVDTGLGSIQVGQTYQNSDGTWDVEVNDDMLTAPDLEAAKRIFVENYDRSKVQVSPMSYDGEVDCAEFQIIPLCGELGSRR